MTFLSPRTLGIVVMVAFSLQGLFTLLTPGSLRIQKPAGGTVPLLYNLLNLSTILVLTPLGAMALIRGFPVRGVVGGLPFPHALAAVVDVLGLLFFAAGSLVFYAARVALGASFRLGAVPPGQDDHLVHHGVFSVVRHPMYAAVLLSTCGLALLLRSPAFALAFLGLAVTIALMVPVEERQLRERYGEACEDYARRTWKLVPWIH